MSRPREHLPEKILASALAVFRAEGVQVSTAKIAAAAGVSNGTLFNYFPTKQALIDALYVWIKHSLAVGTGEFDPSEPIEIRLRQVWDRWLVWARANRAAYVVGNLLHQAGLASDEAQAKAEIALAGPFQVLNDAVVLGIFVDLPTSHIAALTQLHLDQAVASELDERQADVAFHVLWNGITQKTNLLRS